MWRDSNLYNPSLWWKTVRQYSLLNPLAEKQNKTQQSQSISSITKSVDMEEWDVPCLLQRYIVPNAENREQIMILQGNNQSSIKLRNFLKPNLRLLYQLNETEVRAKDRMGCHTMKSNYEDRYNNQH